MRRPLRSLLHTRPATCSRGSGLQHDYNHSAQQLIQLSLQGKTSGCIHHTRHTRPRDRRPAPQRTRTRARRPRCTEAGLRGTGRRAREIPVAALHHRHGVGRPHQPPAQGGVQRRPTVAAAAAARCGPGCAASVATSRAASEQPQQREVGQPQQPVAQVLVEEVDELKHGSWSGVGEMGGFGLESVPPQGE